MQYQLEIPPRVIIGADARTSAAQEAMNLGWSHVLVVSDPFHEKAGRISEIKELLCRAGLETSVYSGVTGEPDTEMVIRGLKQFKAGQCDGIIALGGGSVIDTAKTISVLAVNDGTVQQFMGTDTVPKPGVGVIALPTTSGTQSSFICGQDSFGLAPSICPDIISYASKIILELVIVLRRNNVTILP